MEAQFDQSPSTSPTKSGGRPWPEAFRFWVVRPEFVNDIVDANSRNLVDIYLDSRMKWLDFSGQQSKLKVTATSILKRDPKLNPKHLDRPLVAGCSMDHKLHPSGLADTTLAKLRSRSHKLNQVVLITLMLIFLF